MKLARKNALNSGVDTSRQTFETVGGIVVSLLV